MERVERGLDLPRRMREHRVPGIGMAVIEDNRIVFARGYGVTEAGGGARVTPATLFLAGSISKPVSAVGALSLVEKGRLSRDEDVNLKLKWWKVPDNAFTEKHEVTLGLILSHTAGFTGGDFFPGYAASDAVPSLVQILEGRSPANNDPIRVGFVPGSKWHYSGDGYLVAQQLMVDVTGETFLAFMRSAVFDRLGMHDSTFEQPLPGGPPARKGSGTLASGDPVRGGWHVTPEMAAGGLWSTPSDLARLAIELSLPARGRANHILSQAMTRDMLAPHGESGVINVLGSTEDPDRMGYGFFVGRDRGRFGHIGGNVGYQATLVMLAETGDGVVIMTNSDVGLLVGNLLVDRIAEVHGWTYVAPPPPG